MGCPQLKICTAKVSANYYAVYCVVDGSLCPLYEDLAGKLKQPDEWQAADK